jgi:hypothetical protein
MPLTWSMARALVTMLNSLRLFCAAASSWFVRVLPPLLKSSPKMGPCYLAYTSGSAAFLWTLVMVILHMHTQHEPQQVAP